MSAKALREDRTEGRLFSAGPPLLAILLIAYALRLWQLGAQSLWYDEAVSVFIARQPIADLIAHTAGDIHPPLYYLLLHTWLGLTGSTEFAAAYFSLCFGVLLVALVFRLARNSAGTHAGVIAALLAAVSSFNLWYSQEIRMYTLAACLAVLSLMLLARLWEVAQESADNIAWARHRLALAATAVGYAAVVALGMYTHYYFVFLWIFEHVLVSAWLVASWVRERRMHRAFPTRRGMRRPFVGPEAGANGNELRAAGPLPDAGPPSVAEPGEAASQGARPEGPIVALVWWHVTQLLVVAFFAPWLPVALRQATDPPVPPWRTVVGWASALGESFSALAFGQSLPQQTGWLLVALVALLYVLGVAAWWRKGRGLRTSFSLFGATATPLLLIVLVSPVVPLYHVRYVFIYAAFFYVLLAMSLLWLAQRSVILAVVLVGIYVGGSLYAEYFRRFDAAYAKDDYRSAVQTIATRARAGDAVLINAGYIYPTFVYYYHGNAGWRGRLDDYRGDESPETLVVAETGSLHASRDLGWGSATSDFYASDEQRTSSALALLLSKHARVWVLRANDSVNDPDGFIRAYLASHALEFDEVSVRGESFVKVQGFVARNGALKPGPANAVNASFGQRVALLGWSGAATTTAGSDLPLSLWWKANAPIDVDYHMSLGLYDITGIRWAATDGLPVGSLLQSGDWPAGQVLPADASINVPVGTPPGEYTLQLAVYDPATGKDLPVPSGADGTRARLGVLHVVRPTNTAAPAGTPAVNLNQPVFDGRLALEQAQFAPTQVRPGESIHAALLWHVLSAPLEDSVVFFQLLDDKGRLWAAQESAPVDGRYPTSQWVTGEYVRDARDLMVPPDMPDGRYHVVAGLYRVRDRERLPVRIGWLPFANDALELGTVDVKGREHVMQAPRNVGTPARVRFGDVALLVGYDVQAPSIAAGRNLTLSVTWQALAPTTTPLKVFAHLVGANEQIAAQRDSEPGDGALPTTSWLAGEYLNDRYVLELPANLAPGDYAVYIGLYNPQTTVRLSVFDADNKSIGDRWLVQKLALR